MNRAKPHLPNLYAHASRSEGGRAQQFRAGPLALALVALGLVAVGAPRGATAQGASRVARRWSEAAPGSELERYLRLIQLAGDAPLAPWGVRAFTLGEFGALAPSATAAHPWKGRLSDAPASGWWFVRPRAELIANSGLPWGSNDGPLWAGKGITAYSSGGVAFRRGPLSGQVAPDVWWTQNAAYALLPSSKPANPMSDFAANDIDLPQRFGDAGVGRIDPGESWVRLDAFGLAAGLSTASEWWGPGQAAGAILSPNAGGVPRLFAGTSRPADLWIGKVHGRIFGGRAVRSALSTDTLSNAGRRLVLGFVGTFTPRGIPQLEFGLTRFFHRRWRDGGPNLDDVRVLWEPFYKEAIPGKDDFALEQPDNQLASISARLTIPQAAMELYTEYVREDHSFNTLDLITEPDHNAAILFGWQKLLQRNDERWWAMRGELVNARVTHLARIRPQVLFYGHYRILDGHTQRGQLLGSPIVRGGSGGEFAVDRYTPRGRLSFQWQRQGLAGYAEGGLGYGATHALTASGLRYGTRGDLSWRAGLVQRVGDDASRDLTSVHAALGWRWAR